MPTQPAASTRPRQPPLIVETGGAGTEQKSLGQRDQGVMIKQDLVISLSHSTLYSYRKKKSHQHILLKQE